MEEKIPEMTNEELYKSISDRGDCVILLIDNSKRFSGQSGRDVVDMFLPADDCGYPHVLGLLSYAIERLKREVHLDTDDDQSDEDEEEDDEGEGWKKAGEDDADSDGYFD